MMSSAMRWQPISLIRALATLVTIWFWQVYQVCWLITLVVVIGLFTDGSINLAAVYDKPLIINKG
jgi:uncharacterized membrane protein